MTLCILPSSTGLQVAGRYSSTDFPPISKTTAIGREGHRRGRWNDTFSESEHHGREERSSKKGKIHTRTGLLPILCINAVDLGIEDLLAVFSMILQRYREVGYLVAVEELIEKS